MMARAMRHFLVAEKEEENAGDKLMAMLGFTAIRFSQSRATRQTPGISDRLYVHERRQLAVFWEAKREGGKQSIAQRWFQGVVESQGWNYVCGTSEVLTSWCRSKGLVR